MEKFREDITVPSELDSAIMNGVRRGKNKMDKRNKTIKNAGKIAACFVVAVGVFATSVNVAPAFAASMEDIPVLGSLVKIFQINKTEVSGGTLNDNSKGEIYLNRKDVKEQLIINFADSENANLYEAKYEKNPQSITITLPGTRDVTMLSDYKRAQGESDYIKSVYPLITLDDSIVRYVVEIEDFSNVQVSEYKKPGQIVIEFTKSDDYPLNDIYSVRSYSYENNEEFAQFEESLQETDYRILKDELEKRFFEFAQFDNEKDAESFAKKFDKMSTIIEKRYNNNVPVSFAYGTNDYEEYQFTLKYVDFLQNATTPEEIMCFIDQNKDKYPQELDIMLKGLTGMLRGMDESEYDYAQLDKYYALIGTTAKEALNNYYKN